MSWWGRFAADSGSAFDAAGETLAAWGSAFLSVAAFVLTAGYVDHLNSSVHCPHCNRKA